MIAEDSSSEGIKGKNPPHAIPQGLTLEQVRQRRADGQGNTAAPDRSKTVGQILAGNILTYFNLINSLIFLLILVVGQYANGLFMGVVAVNILIGIIQEIRAKKVLDRLAIITAVHVTVIRGGTRQQVTLEELVMGDIYQLSPGDQVCADGSILAAQALEVDESLLTGEAEPVLKQAGDEVLSGSFAVAGGATVQVIRVGQENYAQKITSEIRRYKRAQSGIMMQLNKVIQVISLIIVPAGLLLFISSFLRSGDSWQDAAVSSAAAMIGMIPQGLVLLTSITLVVGVIRLARQRAVVQELAGIEVLARVNVLCLDKTGTLTRGKMEVSALIPLSPAASEESLRTAVAAVVAAFPDQNSTARALAAYAGAAPSWTVIQMAPFSSGRKWSGVSFAGQGNWLLGAPEILLSQQSGEVREQARRHAETGKRVILLAQSPELLNTKALPDSIVPRALLLLSDAIRPEARAALDFFAGNDVSVKVFSGDHPAAVAAVARELNIRGSDQPIDASLIPDDDQAVLQAVQSHTIFGRVTPQQKKRFVAALKNLGNTVAMTGDGVNDTLALREADCGIAMATGTDAAKQTAHIILLDSDFIALPQVVREGRQVINNIERVASLFLVKTTYAMALALIFLAIGLSYPFDPIHQTLLGGFSIGIPSFFLALEKSSRRVQPGFLRRVLLVAVPGGLCITVMVLLAEVLQTAFRIPADQTNVVTVMVAGIISLLVLLRVASPLNLKRAILTLAMAAIFIAESVVFAGLLHFSWPQPSSLILIALLSALAYPLFLGFSFLLARLFRAKR